MQFWDLVANGQYQVHVRVCTPTHTRSQSFSKLFVEGHNSKTQVAGIYKISDLPEQSDSGSMVRFLIFLYVLQIANSKQYSQQYLLLLFLREVFT